MIYFFKEENGMGECCNVRCDFLFDSSVSECFSYFYYFGQFLAVVQFLRSFLDVFQALKIFSIISIKNYEIIFVRIATNNLQNCA